MWAWGKLFYALCALAWCCGATSAASAQREVAVWYRSDSACPDGPAFLHMLAARSVHARLAQVGDAIDFVVTLGGDGSASSGVLERQTETGTVAIRRVDDPSCDQVAAALSLTLALALEASVEPPPPAQPAPVISAPPEPRPEAAPAPQEPRASRFELALAFAARGVTGIAPGPLLGGSIALELTVGRGLWRPAIRAGALLGYGSGTRDDQDVAVTVAGGRLEGCPIEVATAALALRPCLALEAGQLRSKADGANGRADHGLWLASELMARVRWRLAAALSLEAALGAGLPWTRYELESAGAPQRLIHRTADATAALEIGAVAHFP